MKMVKDYIHKKQAKDERKDLKLIVLLHILPSDLKREVWWLKLETLINIHISCFLSFEW